MCVCLVAKLPRCSGSAIIETGGELETSHSESEGEVEVGTQPQLTGNWNTLGTLNTQGTLWEHSTLREHTGNTLGTLREHTGNTQRTLREHTGNTQGTKGNTQETPREFTGNITLSIILDYLFFGFIFRLFQQVVSVQNFFKTNLTSDESVIIHEKFNSFIFPCSIYKEKTQSKNLPDQNHFLLLSIMFPWMVEWRQPCGFWNIWIIL